MLEPSTEPHKTKPCVCVCDVVLCTAAPQGRKEVHKTQEADKLRSLSQLQDPQGPPSVSYKQKLEHGRFSSAEQPAIGGAF